VLASGKPSAWQVTAGRSCQLAQNPEAELEEQKAQKKGVAPEDALRLLGRQTTEIDKAEQETEKRQTIEREQALDHFRQESKKIGQMKATETRQEAEKNKEALQQLLEEARNMQAAENEEAKRKKVEWDTALARAIDSAQLQIEEGYAAQEGSEKTRAAERGKAIAALREAAQKMKTQHVAEGRKSQAKRKREWRNLLGELDKAKAEQAEKAKGRVVGWQYIHRGRHLERKPIYESQKERLAP
jgi:hypothetical protein